MKTLYLGEDEDIDRMIAGEDIAPGPIPLGDCTYKQAVNRAVARGLERMARGVGLVKTVTPWSRYYDEIREAREKKP